MFFFLKIMQVSKKLSTTFYILCWMNVSFYPEECIRNCWFKLTNGVDRGWSSVTLSSYVIDIPIGIRHHFLGNDNIGRVSPSFNSCIEMTYILHRCFNVWQKAVVCSAVKSGISRNSSFQIDVPAVSRLTTCNWEMRRSVPWHTGPGSPPGPSHWDVTGSNQSNAGTQSSVSRNNLSQHTLDRLKI